ncbi:MAG: hypothetical protein QXP60_07740 [Nitrososphaerota archaeon]
MSEKNENLKINISYKDLSATFEGNPEQVYRSVIAFLEKVIPAYSLASRISYSINIQEILEKANKILAYNQNEGIFFLNPINNYSLNDGIMLFLLKLYIEHSVGLRDSPEASLLELSNSLNKSQKSISGKLSNLIKNGYVRRLSRGSYVLTITGLKHLIENIIPKI